MATECVHAATFCNRTPLILHIILLRSAAHCNTTSHASANRRTIQMRQLASTGLGGIEPLLSLHHALGRQAGVEGGGDGVLVEQVHGMVAIARAARREGELRMAQAKLWQASAALALIDSADVGISWDCRWQQAKLWWEEGGAKAADAVALAKRLCEEMGEVEERLDTSQMGLRVRSLRCLGTWMDELQCESRGVIEKVC